MKKTSLGIILPGNPECIQKKVFWVEALEKVSVCGFFISLVLGGIFCLSLFLLKFKMAAIGIGMVLGAGILLWTFLIWGETTRCAYCKHFLTLSRISQDEFVGITQRRISRNVNDVDSGVVYDFYGNSALYTKYSSHTEHGREVEERYTYNVRCSVCGAVCKVSKSKTYQRF